MILSRRLFLPLILRDDVDLRKNALCSSNVLMTFLSGVYPHQGEPLDDREVAVTSMMSSPYSPYSILLPEWTSPCVYVQSLLGPYEAD
jgi:hypothetical protein